MQLSYKFLAQYVDLTNISAKQLAEALTNAGHEVEDIYPLADAQGLVIGQIINCELIPNTHLHKVQVEIASDKVLQIVCGAANCRCGLKVIVARVNACLQGQLIEAKKVHGIVSEGMLCSLKELAVPTKLLSQKQINGIEELADDALVGNENVLAYLGLDDMILDVSLTANRADCLAMWSMAKEVGAILNRQVNLPNFKEHEEIKADYQISLKTNKATYYLGKAIHSLKVGPSPKWLKDILLASGINSINNVVDISNYVMLETGQPLHFYNLNKINYKKIEVIDGVSLKGQALDEQVFDLESEDILIMSNQHLAAIAGIMGGKETMIDTTTDAIFIEAAHFSAQQIRHSANRLNLMTEAATRFIKGIDPLAALKAIKRATDLLVELAQAKEIEETVQAGLNNYQPIVISETLSHLNQVLGTSFQQKEVIDVLKRLDFKPTIEGDKIISHIPSYRQDMFLDADIQEEVIRLLGFASLKTTLPLMQATVGERDTKQLKRYHTRAILQSLGLQEIVTYTLQSCAESDLAFWPLGKAIKLAMPMSEARSVIRNSLMLSILACAKYNVDHKNDNLSLYEISKVYAKNIEQERLAIFLQGNYQEDKLYAYQEKTDFYTLKGIILSYLAKFGIAETSLIIKENTFDQEHFHPYRSALIYLDQQLLGTFGQVHPKLAKQYALKDAYYAEINLDLFYAYKAKRICFQSLDRYPFIERDIALVLKKEIPVMSILNKIKESGGLLVRKVDIFDLYEGEHVEQGYKSIALRIRYQAKDHTLKDEEVNAIHQNILHLLESDLQVSLRS